MDPIIGDFTLDRCTPGFVILSLKIIYFRNYSWNYDVNLIAEASAIRNQMELYKRQVQRENFKTLAKIVEKLEI